MKVNTRLTGVHNSSQTMPLGRDIISLDLASLHSVRQFAQDILLLIAEMQSPTNEPRSTDGYEITCAVNPFAHFLLMSLLLSHLAGNGRLVITTSDTHDPAVIPIAPKTLEPQKLAHPIKGEVSFPSPSELAQSRDDRELLRHESEAMVEYGSTRTKA